MSRLLYQLSYAATIEPTYKTGVFLSIGDFSTKIFSWIMQNIDTWGKNQYFMNTNEQFNYP